MPPPGAAGIGHLDWARAAFAMFAVGWGANQFAPLIQVYKAHEHLGEATVSAMFGFYALGLIPTLLLAGSWADRSGRRRVMRPVLVLSLVATSVMFAGAVNPLSLVPGRFLAGVASGAAFGAGSAWVRELSVDAVAGTGARRSAVALSGGFGLGALFSGLLAQFAPAPEILPYTAHLALGAVALVLAWGAPDPFVPHPDPERAGLVPASARTPRFVLGVAPWAPWVFACATISFTVLPSQLGGHVGGYPVAYAGLMAGVTLITGVLVQPAARRLADASAPWRVPVAGLAAATLGLGGGAALVAATGLSARALLVLPVAVVLGAAYGTLLVGGLVEVELQSGPHDHARLLAVYYALIYLGFAAPYLMAVFIPHGGAVLWLGVCSVICLMSIPLALVRLRAGRGLRRGHVGRATGGVERVE